MSTLTDRYVWDVTRRLPASRRDDIERELRSTIADMAEAADERTALVELGDPARLAAEYRSGGRALIGDDLYPEYVRQLRRWLTIVVPVITTSTGTRPSARSSSRRSAARSPRCSRCASG
jgi:hypothetical protein